MLRITSGEFRNRRIAAPDTGEVRPMLERPRMAIFSILGQDVAAGRWVIDCFAGTGVLGLEALSRGASHALFFDIRHQHVKALQELTERLGCEERCRVRRSDVMAILTPKAPPPPRPEGCAKLIFLDPPHAMSNDPDHLFYGWFEELAGTKVVGADTIAVLGHHSALEPPLELGRWGCFDRRKYSNAAIAMYGSDGYDPLAG